MKMKRAPKKAQKSAKPEPLTPAVLMRLAVGAGCDPRTVAKAIRGEKLRGAIGYRIKETLQKEGLGELAAQVAA